MNRSTILGAVSFFSILAAACATEDVASDDQDISIDKRTEDPATVLGSGYEMRLASVISPADKGKTFGVDDAHVPYPDTYWPFLVKDGDQVYSRNGIDDRWQGKDESSPLEKYMGLVDPDKAAQAKKWEAENHGEKVPGVADWFGHCPGWTAASMLNAPIHEPISVKRDGGKLVKCSSSNESGCTTFEVGDLNALEAEVHLDAVGGFIGARCDTKPASVPRDDNGRITKAGCRGLNPGSFVIVMANRMKNIKNAANFVPKPFAINAQNDDNTDQIWNQPAFRYTVNDAAAISEEQAIQLTNKAGVGRSLPTRYAWNNDAKGFFRVDISLQWVSENGPNKEFVSGLDSAQTTRFAAILELDGDPNNPATRIIGGEFLDDPSIGASRLKVAPFVWTADGLPPDSARGSHNPFVKGSDVQRLVQLATER
jgi:hypothetical protein